MIFSFTFAEFNSLPAYAVIFLLYSKIVLMSASALMGTAGIVHGKFLELLCRAVETLLWHHGYDSRRLLRILAEQGIIPE